MRRRPSARLLVLDRNDLILLFRFVHKRGALVLEDYWVTPGGALEAGESFEDAARRELYEETGVFMDAVGDLVAEREFVMQTPDGERVIAEERYFLVWAADQELSKDGWSSLEKEVMMDHRWWSLKELSSTSDQIFPENLVEILEKVGVGVEPSSLRNEDRR